MTETSITCSTCGLWRRREKPDRREATEYQSWRPCGSNIQPRISGARVMNFTGTQLLTAPETSCDFWIGQGAVHEDR